MPLSEARLLFNALDFFGVGPDMHAVTDFTVAGDIPIRVYQPVAAADCHSNIVFFHGGGWVLGNIGTHDSMCRLLAATAGSCVVSVDYRCAPEHRYPSALQDCFAATKIVAQQPDQIGLHHKPVVVAGDSAGGNLACAVSMMAKAIANLVIVGQVLIYPVVATDFETPSYNQFAQDHGLTREVMQWFWQQYLGDQQPDELADLLLADSFTGLPPTHIVTAEYDVLRSECEQLASRLSDDGVIVSTRQYDGMLHGFMHFLKAFDTGASAIADVGAVIRNF